MVSKKKIKKILSRLSLAFHKKLRLPSWLIILLLTALVLRIPSLLEPYSYGDEMIYLNLGHAIRQGVPLYSGIHDNKPPLLYILAAAAGSLFWFKVILAGWCLATIILFWKLSQALFPRKNKLQKTAVIIFAILTTIPLLEGNIVNAELFMIGPTIGAFLILLTKKLNPKNLFTSGVLFSVATLFKVPAAFDMGTIVFLWLVTATLKKKETRQIIKNTVYLATGLLTPIALTFIWYGLAGALSEYATAAFLQNIGYLSTWRPADVEKTFLARNALLFIRAAIVAAGLAILYWKRKKLSYQFIFLTAWLALSLFAVTLSGRPYPHYLVQSVPQVSLLLAMLFTLKTTEQSLVIIPISVAFFVPVYFKFWYYPTTPYYARFINFATGKIDRNEYLSSFGGNVLRNYKIAKFIIRSSGDKNKLFVWGDGSAIYALTRHLPPGKYVADYHIRDFSSKGEVLLTLRSEKPEFVVVLPDAEEFPELISFLSNNFYAVVTTIDGAEIWKLVSLSTFGIIAP